MSAGQGLTRQRCFNHELREAAARCPECQHFYCRECVTEHEGRVLCVDCLKQLLTPAAPPKGGGGWLLLVAQAVFALVLLWAIFQSLGEGLAALPDSFHENGLWQVDGSE